MTPDFIFRAGDTLPTIQATLTNESGAVNVAGCTIELAMRLVQDDGSLGDVVYYPADIVDGPAGEVQHVWISGQSATYGYYRCWWRVTYPGPGGVATFPNNTYLLLQIIE